MKRPMRAILLLVALIFVFNIAACNNGTETTGGQTTTSGTTSQTSTTQETVDPNQKYEETVVLTSVRQIPDPSIFRNLEGMTLADNIWLDTIKEMYNIEIQYDWTVDVSNYVTRFNAMLASGDIPDFFQVPLNSLGDLIEADLIQEIGPLFDSWATENVKTIYSEAGENVILATTFNGKQMGIPFLSGGKEFSQVLWLNEKWLEAVDLDLPKTVDDVKKIAIAFATQDPDQNGANDTFGLPVHSDTSGGLMWNLGFYNAYNAYPYIWIEKDGKLAYGSIQPEVKTALANLNELYKAGAIDPEFLTQTYWSMYEPMGAGKFGMIYGPYYAVIAPINTYRAANPDSGQWVSVELPGLTGPSSVQVGSAAAANAWVINKDCKNPGAVMQLLNLWYEKFYFTDSEDTYYTFINERDGNPTYNYSPISSYREFHNLSINLGAKDIFDGKVKYEDALYLHQNTYDTVSKYIAENNAEFWWHERVFDCLTNVIKSYKDDNRYVETKNYSPPDVENNAGAEMADLYSQEMTYFTKIITGEYGLDKFDEFVELWKAGGGEKYSDYVNSWFDSIK
jgi:putative aldouronate transport system substrate-binding protein